jgi:phenylalanyl-tRNA synthetase beta chain
MRHGIFSEAITRFTKGQPAELTAHVLIAAIHLINKWAGATPLTNITDIYPNKSDSPTIQVSRALINDTLGTDITMSQITKTLEDAEFTVSIGSQDSINIKAPYWRSDIHINEDIVEEVGRLNGFDNINPTLPTRNFTATKPSDFDIFRAKIRKVLVRAGANEILTYSFVHSDVLKKANQDIKNSYRITNSISPDLQYYRQTLTPSLLNLINPNIRQGYDNFAIFEVNKVHQKQNGLTDENVPVETDTLALVIANKNKVAGSSYYHTKRLLDHLCESLGLELLYSVMSSETKSALSSPLEYRHSAQLTDKRTGLPIGMIGEFKKSVSRNFKLPEYTSGFEIDTRALFDATRSISGNYQPLSRYPASERDICFQVTKDTPYAQIVDLANAALEESSLETHISPVDIYQPDGSETKNITIRIKLVSHDHTLTSEYITSVISSVTDSVVANTNATII